MIKRVFLIVLDSLGVGELPDAKVYGDEGSNTLKSCFMQEGFSVPTLKSLGLFNIDGIDYATGEENPKGAYGRLKEKSKGKDTTTGHWEICGLVSETPFPTYPGGFPEDILGEFTLKTGKEVLCNKPYSGTAVIKDYGKEHLKTGDLIIYTSADSVFQIAAHKDIISVNELYSYCEAAREILKGKHAVGRVIARPFEGEYPAFKRSSERHDFSLVPPKAMLIDELKENGFSVIPIGKIYDIFAGKSMEKANPTVSNADGMEKTTKALEESFNGLCFVNLVDFDMLYGHRNDAEGYARALMEFDSWLSEFITKLQKDDVLIITADHGCDPLTQSTDHSREYTPVILFGEKIKSVNLGTRESFADIGKTVADLLGVNSKISGESFKKEILGE